MTRAHNHYFKDVSHLKTVDVYRVLELFGVTDPCIQHAVKKLLVAGGRGAGKDIEKDVRESVDSLNRFLQMRAEDDNAVRPVTNPLVMYTAGVNAFAHGVDLVLPKTTEQLSVERSKMPQFAQGLIHARDSLVRGMRP